MRKMPAMAAMHRIRFLSATGKGLQARERIESYLASRLNGEKIFASGSVSRYPAQSNPAAQRVAKFLPSAPSLAQNLRLPLWIRR
jgi:hypothetical protein